MTKRESNLRYLLSFVISCYFNHENQEAHSICKLNQSPWDVISFPIDSASSSYQVDQDGCFLDSYGLDKSASPNKMSTIGEEVSPEKFMPKEGLLDLNASEKTEHGDGAEGRKDQLGFKKEETVFCSRNDGKGWHCKKPVHKTYSLCKHHLARFKMYQTSAYRARMKRTVGKKDKIRHNPRAANAPSAAD
ncbi:hypothetical protein Vadar_025022 [Vaccinium darrowii]|uniref:Uncharacterized protein n=1 Tax=Vaccinium darrowii TaxID=229202 RepID=A0ACB7Z088_9ERIC|nr:hypothetical protein Vadar_025022 [Vaccinium darrowii]